jgi:thiol:disulfide interchange protein DsbC
MKHLYILSAIISLSVSANIELIINKVQSVLPDGAVVERIEESEISGIYKVFYGDLQPIYVSSDGDFFIYGDMYSIKNESIKNLTQEDFIYFKSPAERHLITVFTDVDCGYCRKFHKEIESYNLKGISVRYLAFPRSGIGNDSYNKMVSTWCSKDRNQSLSQYKEDIQKELLFCEENPIESHYNIGRYLGVTGTPAIFTAKGEYIKGYYSPEDLLELLE